MCWEITGLHMLKKMFSAIRWKTPRLREVATVRISQIAEERSDMPSTSVVLDGHAVVLFGVPGDTYFTSIVDTPVQNITTHFDTLNGCLQSLPVDAVALDVGANIGLTVAAASKRLT